MTREELKAALRAAADDYKRATDEAVAAYGRGYADGLRDGADETAQAYMDRVNDECFLGDAS